jgi:hypothetical protein
MPCGANDRSRNVDREDVIRLAREAGFNVKHLYGEDEVCEQEYEYWRENPDIGQDVITHTVERFADLVAAAEREACAKVCEAYIAEMIGREMATAIRARGET